MMNFIRDNIVKIGIGLVVLIILIVVINACSKMGGGTSDSEAGYLEMENRLQGAAIKYGEKNKRILPIKVEQVKKIQLSTLIANGLMNELHAVENPNVQCRGYVEITKRDLEKDSYRYTPFIKCGKYYQTKTIAEHIIENEEIVTSGEGLYQVVVEDEEPTQTEEEKKEETTTQNETEEEKETTKSNEEQSMYYFKGEYPNNYIKIGDRLYRILEISPENNLKLLSTKRTEYTYEWDDRFNVEDDDYTGINDFSKSRLKENLNMLYANTDENEFELFFTDEEKNFIVSHDYCVGKKSFNDKTISDKAECSVKEKLKVGLITLNDYYRTSIDKDCTANDKLACNNYNFLFTLTEGEFFTLTANADNTSEVLMIDYGEITPVKAEKSKALYPVIYVDRNILYKSGTGSQEDPYIVR